MADVVRDVESGLPVELAVNDTHGPKTVTVVNSTPVVVIAAPGVEKNIYVAGFTASHAGTGSVILFLTADGDIDRFAIHASSSGGVVPHKFDPPWKLPENKALAARLNLNLAEPVRLNLNYTTAL